MELPACQACGSSDRVVERRPVAARLGARGTLQVSGETEAITCRSCGDVFLPLTWEYGDAPQPERKPGLVDRLVKRGFRFP